MEILAAIAVGAFVSKWRDCFLIALAVGGLAALYRYGKVANRDPTYVAGYLGGFAIGVVILALVAHGVRRLVLYGLRSGSAE